jgi:hypothetical protein
MDKFVVMCGLERDTVVTALSASSPLAMSTASAVGSGTDCVCACAWSDVLLGYRVTGQCCYSVYQPLLIDVKVNYAHLLGAFDTPLWAHSGSSHLLLEHSVCSTEPSPILQPTRQMMLRPQEVPMKWGLMRMETLRM